MEIKSIESLEYGDNEVGIDDISITYCQKGDNTGTEDYQDLTISTRSNGLARYYNISTESWSFDNIDEFIKLLNDFKQRALLEK